MAKSPRFSPPPSIHVELFVTRRSDRERLRRGCQGLYALVRPITRRDGGSGPHLFLLETRPGARTWPKNLREAIGARPDEDVWLELAFYPSVASRRKTLRHLWAIPQVVLSAEKVEGLTQRRRRTWVLATGGAQLEE